MNILNKLEELAYSLPCDSKRIANLSGHFADAITRGDGNAIKEYLSENQTNADMTRVTIY